ncbi:MAG: archaeal proteasome endopeptidase complex subunit alpha [Thermoplasmata archaeon]|nr:archaeal proteasome endopeptidase complex subunit alpha [Thermoplasmata archaeon]MVT13528.1 archaeal proteasome endopeptidase complex subunit alpha [Euryarchaeota archaeon]MVT14237.1 archaeal proteasome endopeptidase complex subunit alpha [Euryarchaeota archaeon]MVT35918.1 archaeal proteasome endopeptidase complex subunit alpha [Euryarchaeota archaeon]
MQPAQMAYDRAITVFSPEGRLYQVEYAREAVKMGSTTIGIKFKDGVALIIDKKVRSRLIEPKSIEKIYIVDEHIGAASSGLMADARVLVDYARVTAQVEKVTYGEKIGVEPLVKKISDYVQQYTQYGGVRPFGTSLLIAGIDDTDIYLFETEPSGAFTGYKASCIGRGRETVMAIFEKEYQENMQKDDAIMLALKAMKQVSEDPSQPMVVEIGLITRGTNFRILPQEETEAYIKKLG